MSNTDAYFSGQCSHNTNNKKAIDKYTIDPQAKPKPLLYLTFLQENDQRDYKGKWSAYSTC